MPVFLPSPKRPLRFPFPSKPISSSSTPTHEDVAHLILHQKTPAQALQTFRWAGRLPSFRHGPTTYQALIRALASFRRLDAAQRILLDEIPSATGSPPDAATVLALVRGLARARMPRDALKVLDLISSRFGIRDPPLAILNAVLDALVKDDIDLARHFLRTKMIPRGCCDGHTFGILMKGVCRTNRIAEGFKLLKLMKSAGLPPNPVVYNTLIHALCRNGKVGRGRSLMGVMESPSVVTFNILISAYCSEGNLVQALVMLEKSFDLGFVPDAISVTKIVELLCGRGRAMEAVEILERAEKRGCAVDVVAYNTLIKGFCEAEKPHSGLLVLREMESKGCLPNIHTYNSLIAGFCDSGKLDSAMDVFREMRTDAINPDNVTFETLVRGFCFSGRVGDGLKVLGIMEEERGGLGDRISPYNSILYGFYKEHRLEEAYAFIDRMKSSFPRAVERTSKILGFCKEGKVVEARLVFDQMITEGGVPSAIVYSSLIDGLCEEGSVREAFNLMNEMVEKGFFPAVSTFNALIHGFCREGKFRSAAKLLEEMVGRGCSPNAGSYNPLVGALCREGDFERAFGFLVKMAGMDVIPDPSTWNSLLASEALWPGSKTEIRIDDVIRD